MGDKENSSKKLAQLEKTAEHQANTIAKLENEIKKLNDPNAEPRIIQKGKQVHPKYKKNTITIAATIPKPK